MYPTKKLKEICEILLGGTPPRNNKNNFGGDFLWCSIRDMKTKLITDTNEKLTDLGVKNSNVKLLKKGTLFMSFKLSLGKLAFAGKDLYTNEAIAGLPIKNENELDKNFLYYILSGYDFKSSGTDNSVKGATLNKAKLEVLQIPLPPLPTQKLIVQKLDSSFENIDKSIELTKNNLKNLQELNKSVLEEVFKNSDYEKNNLLSVADFYSKGILPNNQDLYNYIGLENIESNTGKLVDFKKTEGLKIKSNKVSFLKGMVLYSKLRPYLNKVLVTEFYGIATTEILPIKCGNKLFNYFLGYFLRTDYFVNIANSNVSGARMPRVTTGFLKTIQIPLPPLEKQKEIVAYLDDIFEKNKQLKESYEKKLKDLQGMKQTLLKEAFEGRLVKE